ncbi:MAG: DUF1427 family protein [Burkholderiaceae bacterium]
MKSYAVSLAVGVLAGALYGLTGVHSPAPPLVALMGLMGILLGEQLVPIIGRYLSQRKLTAKWVATQCKEHMFAQMPGTATETKGGEPFEH